MNMCVGWLLAVPKEVGVGVMFCFGGEKSTHRVIRARRWWSSSPPRRPRRPAGEDSREEAAEE